MWTGDEDFSHVRCVCSSQGQGEPLWEMLVRRIGLDPPLKAGMDGLV